MKNEININWDCDDAKGKNYCLYSESNHSCRFYKTKPIIDSEGLWTYNKNYFGDPLADKWALHERPKEKPKEKQMDSIYTQEMHNAGEVPKVGMKLLFNYLECKIVAVTETGKSPILTFIKDNGIVNACFFQLDNECFKPIDTRTDREKAIDDLNKFFAGQSKNDIFHRWSVNLLDDIKLGEIHGVTFTENKND